MNRRDIEIPVIEVTAPQCVTCGKRLGAIRHDDDGREYRECDCTRAVRSSADRHTPGPWTYNGKSRAIYAWGAVGTSVANCTEDAVGVSSDANCRLIAAAPDLLYALTALTARVQMANAEGDPIASALIPDCLAAIAKAEGRTDD